MKLQEEINRVQSMMGLIYEQTDCKPLPIVKPDGYENKEYAKVKAWIEDINNHNGDIECQKKRYKQFQSWLEENGENPDKYTIEIIQTVIDDEVDDEVEVDEEDCGTWEEWKRTTSAAWADNEVLEGRHGYISLDICEEGERNEEVFINDKDGCIEKYGATKCQQVRCYYCNTNTKDYEYKPAWTTKEAEAVEEENCDNYVTFFYDEGIEICSTTDASRLTEYLGIHPTTLLQKNSDEVTSQEVFDLTGKWPMEIYTECVKQTPTWQEATTFRFRKSCVAKYKSKLSSLDKSDPHKDEEVIQGLEQLLEPFNAVVTMCLDQGCGEVVSVYSGQPQNYISTEIKGWSHGSAEVLKSLNIRFYSKKKAVDSWLTSYLSEKQDKGLDLKNIPFIGTPSSWPDQNVKDIIENSIALLLTNPVSLEAIEKQTTKKAYINIKNANPQSDGTYKVVFDSSLLPDYILFIHTKEDICPRLKMVAQQNGYGPVSLNEYNEKISELGLEEQKFVDNIQWLINGYGCDAETPYFLPIE